MSTEGTSDVLLDMSATIPRGGSEIKPFREEMRDQVFKVRDDNHDGNIFRSWDMLTDAEKRRANEIEEAEAGKASAFKVKPREVEYIVPFGDRIVVLPDSPEELVGSLYVPDTAQERPARGTVLAIGPLVDKESIGEGMKVIYGHFTGSECMHGGKECLIMREADLYGGVRTVTV